MSDPSFSDTVNQVKGAERKVTTIERDIWNNSKPKTRINLLKGRLTYTEAASNLGLETATENAYQQDYTAKINQLINTNYDSLPESVRTTITEALIEQGALPNPSTYKGIGHEFAVGKEVFIECDRCDQEFFSEEDFDMHKELDHGDHENAEEQEDAEDILANMKDPEISLEALKEARRLLTETDEGDLHRSVYFNGDQFPQPTETEPEDIKGKKGYDDNPNKGLYDNKIFVKGKASSRQDGSVTESFTTEACSVCGGDHSPATHGEDKKESTEEVEHEYACPECDKSFGSDALYDHLRESHKKDESEAHNSWMHTTGKEEAGYEGNGNDVEYDQSQTLSDIREVQEEDSGLDIPELDKVDFAEEKIDYVYPTTKVKASEVEEKDPFLEEYGDDDIESDKEAVENQIISRKLHGYSPETIAREMTIQYGVSHDEALEKVYSIEVSVNDKVANTFFGKRFHECTEAEKDELRMYSGSDTEDDKV